MKFVILFALVGLAFAEPPSSYGAPQQSYGSPSYSSSSYSSSYDDSGSSGDDYVDDALLARIAQLLEQNEGGYSSGGYSQPSTGYGQPSTEYGGPSRSSGGIQLGRPERAQLISSFDLTDNTRSGGYQGGYQQQQGGYDQGWN